MNDMSDILYLMAGMVLFSILVNNSNIAFVRNSTLQAETEIEFNAIAVAQSIIDEAKTKAFDQVVAGNYGTLLNQDVLPSSQIPSAFTAPSSLGPESGEVYPNFNDFDDYHGLNLTRATGFGNYQVTATVFYVNPNNPETNIGARSINKRLMVTVTHPMLQSPISLTYIKTYF